MFLREPAEEIGLVFKMVFAFFQQESAASVRLDAGVMSGGQKVGAELPGFFPENTELNELITADTRIWG